jgi:hypothetical protein
VGAGGAPRALPQARRRVRGCSAAATQGAAGPATGPWSPSAGGAAPPGTGTAGPAPAGSSAGLGRGGAGDSEPAAAILYWWPDEGWQLGRVRHLSCTDQFTHVVGYWLRSHPVVLKSARDPEGYRQSLQYGPGRATADISYPERWDDFSKPFLFLA